MWSYIIPQDYVQQWIRNELSFGTALMVCAIAIVSLLIFAVIFQWLFNLSIAKFTKHVDCISYGQAIAGLLFFWLFIK